jgi:hypothetical protein
MCGSVKPSPAALIRAAFNLFESLALPIKKATRLGGFFGRG